MFELFTVVFSFKRKISDDKKSYDICVDVEGFETCYE